MSSFKTHLYPECVESREFEPLGVTRPRNPAVLLLKALFILRRTNESVADREYKESLHFGRSRAGFRDKATIFPSDRKDIFSLRGHPRPVGLEIRIHRFDLLIFGDNKSLRRSIL